MTLEQWNKIVEIQAQIEREMDSMEERYPHPSASDININEIGAQTPTLNLKS